MEVLDQVLALLDQEEAVQFLQSVIQFDTTNPPGSEMALARYISNTLRDMGIESHIDLLSEDRANVIGCIKGSGECKDLLFNGHLDVVPPGEIPWQHDPFAAEIDEGKVYGRGTSDMKSGLAATVMAAGIIARAGIPLKGDLLITGTAGEETDSVGAHDLLARGYLDNVDAAVIGEPSMLKLFCATKGALWIEFQTFGKTAHGSMPEQGFNAILQMNALINKLKVYPFEYTPHALLGHPTMNIATIQGGVKTNVVPDACKLTVDIRTVPGMNHAKIIADMEQIMEELAHEERGFQGSFIVTNNRTPVETDVNSLAMKNAVQAAKQVTGTEAILCGVNYYTDGSVFAPSLGIPVILFGPGDETLAHQPDEYVEIEHYIQAIKFYIAFVLQHLG